MALNPFFTQGTRNEQNLLQSLNNEMIKMYGVECYYIPRKYLTTNTVIKEVIQSKFDDAYPIEMYIKNVDGFEGEGAFISRFGLEVRQQITFSLARSVWASMGLSDVPKEGDLIYFPLTKKLFEIQFVVNEAVFYQAGTLQTFDIQCELFEYSDEDLDTGIDAIDAIEESEAYVQTFPITFTDQGFILTEDGSFIINEDTPDTAIEGGGNKIIQDTVPLFVVNEVITGQTTLGTGNIVTSNATHIKVTNVQKTFIIGEEVVGTTSEARGTLGTRIENVKELSNDPAANNVTIETIADGIIDFSEDNPFSEDI